MVTTSGHISTPSPSGSSEFDVSRPERRRYPALVPSKRGISPRGATTMDRRSGEIENQLLVDSVSAHDAPRQATGAQYLQMKAMERSFRRSMLCLP